MLYVCVFCLWGKLFSQGYFLNFTGGYISAENPKSNISVFGNSP